MTEITLEEAEKIAERLEKANAEQKTLLERAERLKAYDVLGGKSDAGTEVVRDIEKEKTDAINAKLKSMGLHI